MAYDPSSRRVVLYTGQSCGSGACTTHTWTWDGRKWTREHAAEAPEWAAGMVTDAAAGRVLLIGGPWQEDSVRYIWTWTGETWRTGP
jgi:hypothetical protein